MTESFPNRPENNLPGNTLKVTVIDTGLGNVRSVTNALEAVGAKVKISDRPIDLMLADRLILPGVGAFEDGMNNLKAKGLVTVLNRLVLEERKPILGICLGMQLLAKTSYENGRFDGLGWIDAEVARFDATKMPDLKIPHVGWNDVRTVRENPLMAGSEPRSYYFVHSYHYVCRNEQDVIGVCDYGYDFAAVVRKDNIFGAQFHPEKSQKHGLALLKSFLKYSESTHSTYSSQERDAC